MRYTIYGVRNTNQEKKGDAHERHAQNENADNENEKGAVQNKEGRCHDEG